MACVGVKVTVGRLLGSSSLLQTAGRVNCRINTVFNIQVAAISGKALRDKNYKRPAPWPYKERRYNVVHSWFDKTTYRMDENSKVIVVEGPPAAGKTEFARALAEDLDMLHMPEVTMDMHYINPYGYDLRQLDPLMPPSLQSYDHRDFCQRPKHPNAAGFQMFMYRYRLEQYIDALAHLLNTGQGVVLERCVYSDFVFADAMFKSGYLSKEAHSVYYAVRKNTITELLRPHLVIYLDVPAASVPAKVTKRGLPHEKNSEIYSNDFLKHLEEAYKQKYLREISGHAHLLIYDWSEGGDVEVVVEDVERVDFDVSDKHDPKLRDWKDLHMEREWTEARVLYTNDKHSIMSYLNVPRYDAPELIVDADDALQYRKVLYSAPGMRYAKGYNKDVGDTGLLFKMKIDYRSSK